MGTKGIAAAVAAGALVLGVMAATNNAAAVPVNIISNGSFEDINTFDGWTVIDQEGSAGTWCPQIGTDAPGITFSKGGFTCGGEDGSGATVPPPPQGSIAAMTDQGDPSASALYQCVDIPSSVRSANLRFQLYLLNLAEEWFTQPTLELLPDGKPGPQDLARGYEVLGGKGGGASNQQFRADIITPEGIQADPFTVTVLENIYQTQPGDPTESGYDLITVDLSAYIGQSVCVRFVVVDNEFYLNAGVDDVQLVVDTVEQRPTSEPLSPPPEADEGPIAAPDTGSNDASGGTSAMLWLVVAALVVTATGAATFAYARRR